MNDFLNRFKNYPMGQKVLFLFMLMIFMFIGFYFLAYSPTQDQIVAQKQTLSNLERDRQKLKQLKANRADILAKLEVLKRQLLIAREKLPVTAEVPSLLQRIHNQAKTAGLDIEEFKRLKDESKSYYVEIPVDMNLVGTYDELANFFYYVGRMTRIVNIKDIQLQVIKANGVDGELKVSASAVTFMYKSENKAPAGPGGRPPVRR